MVRSLDASGERLSGVLDVLVQAGRMLTLPGDLDDALSHIAESIVANFADYCAIDVDRPIDATGELHVRAGTDPARATLESSIVERLSDGRETLGTIRCASSAVPMAPALARGIAAEKLDQLGVSGETRFGVLVALGEAVANAVEHAYRGGDPGLIRLELSQEETRFVLGVQDFGRWRPFVHREERGRGLAIMHALVDGVQIHSTRDSTRIVLKAELTESREDYGS